MTSAVPTTDLATTTLRLVDVPSESRSEAAIVELVRDLVPGPPVYDDGEVLLYGDGPIVLAGHLDTIPAQGNLPGRIDGGAVHGLGASDMKSGVAVMIELARAGVPGRYLFFTREEIPVSESPLPALFATGLLRDAELAVVLEPTDCELHAGCLGNLQARITFHGESAHSARPWTGVNAIHELVRGLQPLVGLEPVDVELDGLVYREVVSAVRVEGGIASNVVPATASAELNMRFMRAGRRGSAARAPARRRDRGPEQFAVRAAGARQPADRAPPRARAGAEAEAGVDAGRAVRRAGHRRDQLRAGRDRLRASHRRAGADRQPRALLRDAASVSNRLRLRARSMS